MAPCNNAEWKVKVDCQISEAFYDGITYARGKMTAQPEPSTRHSAGTREVLATIIPAIMMTDTTRGNQNLIQRWISVGTLKVKEANLLKILGTSLKKLDRSTSFLVACHDMLYENRCARIAWLMGMPRPPKKKKLSCTMSKVGRERTWGNCSQERNPHKIF